MIQIVDKHKLGECISEEEDLINYNTLVKLFNSKGIDIEKIKYYLNKYTSCVDLNKEKKVVLDEIIKFLNIEKKEFDLLYKEVKKRKRYFKTQQKKEEKESPPTQTSFFEHENKIYEQIEGNKFIFIKNDEFKTVDRLRVDSEEIIPNQGEELEKGKEVVLLASGIEEYGDVAKLIDDIKKHIHTYYDCEEQTELFASWYILLTWVYDKLSTINYLRAMGDFGTGKSRFCDVVGRICYKPIIGSGAGSVAALKRMVKKWKGTVLTDEGDFKEADEKGEMVKFYNLGFEKNRSIYQCNKNDPNKIEFYDPFCPKIILTRRPFSDSALESRCLTHITNVTERKDIPVLLPKKFYKSEIILRKKLLKFRFDYYYKIDCDNILNVDLGNLEPRLKQGMISFTALFSNIPEVLDKFKMFLNKYQKELIDDRSNSFDGQIVNIIIEFILSGSVYITPKMIAEALPETKYKNTPVSIGKRLKALGILVKQKKIDSENKRIIVIDNLLKNVIKRYCSDNEKVSVVSSVTEVTLTCSYFQNTLKTNKIKKMVDLDTPDTPDTLDTTKKPENIHLNCHICGSNPSHFFEEIGGKPICETCKSAKELNENAEQIE